MLRDKEQCMSVLIYDSSFQNIAEELDLETFE